MFADKSMLNLEELADIMKQRFKGWTIHFGSCNTLKAKDEDLKEFVKVTGASLVTGYTKYVEWSESAALDILLFGRLQYYKSPKHLGHFLETKYPDLIEINGFRFFSKNGS